MQIRAITLLLIIATLTGCGVPGAPLPPSTDVPKFVGDLKAVRKGDTVTLTWTTPTETTDGELIRKPGKMLVQRALNGKNITELKFQTIADVPLEPTLKKERGEEATAKDTLTDSLRSSGAEFAIYIVLAQGHNGRSVGLPNRTSVPLVANAPPPKKISTQPVPTGIQIKWEEAPPPANNTPLQTQYAYKIMRRLQGTNEAVLVKQISASNPEKEFIDTGIEWEKNYQYWITPVTLWQSENRKGEVEGDDSATIDVLAHDSFPPAVPLSLQAVFSAVQPNSFIDLTWSPNTEADLAGYNIYRRTANGPLAKINTELIKTPRYPDPEIQPGEKYFYSVTAVDLRGNESGKSEETSETVPKN
jgi:hypothetical protein